MARKYLDSNVFIYALLSNDKRGAYCREVLFNMVSNKIEAATSVLTWDEVVYALSKHRGAELSIKEGEKFLSLPNLDFVRADISLISKAQKIMSQFGLGPRDSIHIASAILSGCKEIISDDSDLDAIDSLKRTFLN